MLIQALPLEEIAVDARLQVREKLDEATVANYAGAMRQGAAFPPVIVFGGSVPYLLAGGWLRLAAAKQAGLTTILAEIHAGGPLDAVRHAALQVGMSPPGSFPYTAADCLRAGRLLLADKDYLIDLASSGAILNKQFGLSPATIKQLREEARAARMKGDRRAALVFTEPQASPAT